ncbi:MAG: hypothetical protein ACC655_07855 [Rhodothermia bacterium]
MGQSSGSSVYLPELRIARSLIADLSSKKILKSIVSAAAALFMLVSANVLLSLVGRLGFVDLNIALLLVSPFYLGGLSRIWSAFGVSFR